MAKSLLTPARRKFYRKKLYELRDTSLPLLARLAKAQKIKEYVMKNEQKYLKGKNRERYEEKISRAIDRLVLTAKNKQEEVENIMTYYRKLAHKTLIITDSDKRFHIEPEYRRAFTSYLADDLITVLETSQYKYQRTLYREMATGWLRADYYITSQIEFVDETTANKKLFPEPNETDLLDYVFMAITEIFRFHKCPKINVAFRFYVPQQGGRSIYRPIVLEPGVTVDKLYEAYDALINRLTMSVGSDADFAVLRMAGSDSEQPLPFGTDAVLFTDQFTIDFPNTLKPEYTQNIIANNEESTCLLKAFNAALVEKKRFASIDDMLLNIGYLTNSELKATTDDRELLAKFNKWATENKAFNSLIADHTAGLEYMKSITWKDKTIYLEPYFTDVKPNPSLQSAYIVINKHHAELKIVSANATAGLNIKFGAALKAAKPCGDSPKEYRSKFKKSKKPMILVFWDCETAHATHRMRRGEVYEVQFLPLLVQSTLDPNSLAEYLYLTTFRERLKNKKISNALNKELKKYAPKAKEMTEEQVAKRIEELSVKISLLPLKLNENEDACTDVTKLHEHVQIVNGFNAIEKMMAFFAPLVLQRYDLQFIGWNSSSFDEYFLYKYLHSRAISDNIKAPMVTFMKNRICLASGRFQTRDLMRLVGGGSLAEFGKGLKCDYQKKCKNCKDSAGNPITTPIRHHKISALYTEYMQRYDEYAKNGGTNLDAVHDYYECSFLECLGLKKGSGTVKNFKEWLPKIKLDLEKIGLPKEPKALFTDTLEYGIMDVAVLCEGYLKIRAEYETMTRIPMLKPFTLGQISKQFFESCTKLAGIKLGVDYVDSSKFKFADGVDLRTKDMITEKFKKAFDTYSWKRSAMIAAYSDSVLCWLKESISYIDVVSLYPFVMHISRFPAGKEIWTDHFVEGKLGIYTVKVISQKNLPYKRIVPMKAPGEEAYNWDPNSPEVEITRQLCSTDIEQLKKYGCQFEVLYGSYFEDSIKGSDLFGVYAHNFMKMKNLEDVHKESKDPLLNAKYKPARRNAAKSALNIQTGKNAQVFAYADKRIVVKTTGRSATESKIMNDFIAKYAQDPQKRKDGTNGIRIIDDGSGITLLSATADLSGTDCILSNNMEYATFMYAGARKYMYDNFLSKCQCYVVETDSVAIKFTDYEKIAKTNPMTTNIYGETIPLFCEPGKTKQFGQFAIEHVFDQLISCGKKQYIGHEAGKKVPAEAEDFYTYRGLKGEELEWTKACTRRFKGLSSNSVICPDKLAEKYAMDPCGLETQRLLSEQFHDGKIALTWKTYEKIYKWKKTINKKIAEDATIKADDYERPVKVISFTLGKTLHRTDKNTPLWLPCTKYIVKIA